MCSHTFLLFNNIQSTKTKIHFHFLLSFSFSNEQNQLTMNDFSVHRIIGRGGFGEVYGCRKADTGKMYAMKCLDKKRIKMKQGETLALNERTMLSLVSTGVSIALGVNRVTLTTASRSKRERLALASLLLVLLFDVVLMNFRYRNCKAFEKLFGRMQSKSKIENEYVRENEVFICCSSLIFPSRSWAFHCTFAGRLSVHRMHDICISYTRQIVLYFGFNEWRGSSLPFIAAWCVQ